MAAVSLQTQLLRLALPLVPELGFTTQALVEAARRLPEPHSHGLSERTVHALYPSPPPTNKTGLFSRRSLKRDELVADAHGNAPKRDRAGPAKALLEHWLLQGRRTMVDSVREAHLRGDAAIRHGIRHRLGYNEPVLDHLVDDLALLSSPADSALSSPLTLLPVSLPSPYLGHVARIAHDLAKAAGDESQGIDWYSARGRIGTIYGAAELHLLSPSMRSLPTPERLESTYQVVDRMLDRSKQLGQSVESVELFAKWVGKSWAGMGRSLGL